MNKNINKTNKVWQYIYTFYFGFFLSIGMVLMGLSFKHINLIGFILLSLGVFFIGQAIDFFRKIEWWLKNGW